MNNRALVAGWFSFECGHATAGDLLCRDVACEWLREANFPYDVALAKPFSGGVDLLTIDPQTYSHVVFVCGPFQQGPLEAIVFTRFRHCRFIGLSLSMEVPLESWNPFDFLIERNSTRTVNPDLAFASHQKLVPLVGVSLVEDHDGALTKEANAAIERLLQTRQCARIDIDTRLDTNTTKFRTEAEIESVIARMDLLITTRLHGTVLALKNGVPVIAIDAIPGGAKVTLQTKRVGWPTAFVVDQINDEVLNSAFDFCLTDEARRLARTCTERAAKSLDELRISFLHKLKNQEEINASFSARAAAAHENEAWMGRFADWTNEKRSGPRQVSRFNGLLRRLRGA